MTPSLTHSLTQAAPSEPGSWPCLPLEVQARVRQLTSSLHSLLTTLGAREELWSLGPMARVLGDQLEAWAPARARRKTATNRVSVILVDRTLDLASCCHAGPEPTLLARALEVLPRLPGHTTDLQVDLAGLFGLSACEGLVPGSLASPGLREEDRAREEEELEALLLLPEKETLGLLHRNLTKASPKQKSSPQGQAKKFVSGASLQVSWESGWPDLTCPDSG